ncbi:hypothetical protein SAMN04488591_3177 [Microbacterium azadirachtae]|uniref:DUF2264 domain-containing protein n=1 Tax=Microbacterium azadirachtae TaxID=582680 RepID=A0A1I6J047_9MICO|nr:DUF2264 domain-containing protein [Microbacterium azadirachtae]SFR72356.1 hypothetical protein SAMN04488591_3177 [Microbacterium azadirachtae]
MTAFDPARLTLPPEDRALSPHTGWTRAHWAAVADHLLLSLRPFFTSTRSQVRLPGPVSSSGADSDGLEGFARSFLLFAFRLAGERGADPHGFLDWYRDGLVAGTDPQNPERWVLPAEQAQAEVEAASIALGLQLTRPWLWDTLDDEARQRVVDWLALNPVGWYPDNNWLWFRITVETFLASVGGPHDPARIAADLARIEDYYQGDGWWADGALRNYDYYCGWAMHLYPLLWAGSEGSTAFGSASLAPVYRARLAEFLDDFTALIGADGMPVLQGRSLIYRFATAAPLWMGALTGASRQSPGLLRRAASGELRAFLDRGAVDERGLLTMGLYGEWPAMAQTYSGAGSPYWASKGFLGLLLPADHPVWTAVEEPLPIEQGDVRRVIRPAGWLVSGTAADGIVRVINHGSDHALEGDRTGDSVLYGRFGYSSVTLPPLTGDAIDDPADSMVGAVDAAGRSTHRTGFARGPIGDDGVAAYAVSVADAHWVDSSVDGPAYDHGAGRAGRVTGGPLLATASVVRGSWEVRATRRLPRVGTIADPLPVRVSGWPLTDDAEAVTETGHDGVAIHVDGLRSELRALPGIGGGEIAASVRTETGVSPIGRITAIPRLEFAAVAEGDVVVAAVSLGRGEEEAPSSRVVVTRDDVAILQVTWPDGALSTVRIA